MRFKNKKLVLFSLENFYVFVFYFLRLVKISYTNSSSLNPMAGPDECFRQFNNSIYQPHPDMYLKMVMFSYTLWYAFFILFFNTFILRMK